jgi:hypothetical protein
MFNSHFEYFRLQFTNYLPAKIILKGPSNNSFIDSSPELKWDTGTDLDGDLLTYEIEIDEYGGDWSTPLESNQTATDVLSWIVFPSLNDGKYQWRVCANDSYENGPWSDIWNFTLDTDEPIANKPRAPDAYNNTGTVKWIWEPSNDTASGIAGYYVCIGTNPRGTDVANNEWTTDAWFEISDLEDGKIYYCMIKAKNNAGTTSIFSDVSTGIMVDMTPPEALSFSINNNAKYTNQTEVNLSLNAEDSGSGLHLMTFSNDGKVWLELESYGESKSLTLSAIDGTKTIYYMVNDKAGNFAEPVSESITLDTFPPHSLSLSINDGAKNTNNQNVQLTLNAVDDTSGLNQMSFSTDGSTWSVWESFNQMKSYNLEDGDGTKTIYYKVSDNAGNIAEVVMAAITLNTTPLIIDSDDDGYPDNEDAFPDDPEEWLDTDGDEIGNNADPDDDNDGISDINENILGTDPLLKDTDSDGHNDGEDAYPLDSTRWKKKSAEPEKKSNTGFFAFGIIIVIVVVILLFFFIIKPKIVKKKDEEVSDDSIGEVPVVPPVDQPPQELQVPQYPEQSFPEQPQEFTQQPLPPQEPLYLEQPPADQEFQSTQQQIPDQELQHQEQPQIEQEQEPALQPMPEQQPLPAEPQPQVQVQLVPCPLCQKEIGVYSNPCPQCGGALNWG